MREVNFQSEGESESEEYSSRLSKSITLNTHSQFCFVASKELLHPQAYT